MQRHALITSMVLLVPAAASCGGDPSHPSSVLVDAELGGVVESEDGRFRLEIPPGALAHDTEISATLIPQGEWPADVAELQPAADVYDLQPDGLRFSAPVRLVQEFEHDHDTAFPLLFGVSRSTDGELSMMDDSWTRYDVASGTATFTAELHHFSTAIARYTFKKLDASQAGNDPREFSLVIEELVDPQLTVGQVWTTNAWVEHSNDESLSAMRHDAGAGGSVELKDRSRLTSNDALSSTEVTELYSEIVLGLAQWKCRTNGPGATSRSFSGKWGGLFVGVTAVSTYQCDLPADTDPTTDGTPGGTGTGEDDTGDSTTGSDDDGTTGGEATGGEATGGETTGGEATGGEATGGETTGGETTGGAEPWHACLEQPADLCEVCCELMSENGEQFEQCLAGCG
jgi:hypothetical protein